MFYFLISGPVLYQRFSLETPNQPEENQVKLNFFFNYLSNCQKKIVKCIIGFFFKLIILLLI